jgi:hypothetical protein
MRGDQKALDLLVGVIRQREDNPVGAAAGLAGRAPIPRKAPRSSKPERRKGRSEASEGAHSLLGWGPEWRALFSVELLFSSHRSRPRRDFSWAK